MSDTVEHPYRGPPETNVAAGGGTREEGGTASLAEWSDITHKPAQNKGGGGRGGSGKGCD